MANSHPRRSSSSGYPTLSLSTTAASLLLAALLPSNAIAQDVPTTLLTSTIASSAVASLSATSIFPSFTSSPGASSSTTSSPTPAPTTANPNPRPSHTFNNYWSFIIVMVVLLIITGSLYTLRKRKMRMLSAQRHHARSLSGNHDVGGLRSPRYGLGWGWPQDGDRTTPPPGIARTTRRGRRGHQIEGLNERGEAPPPYTGVGSKPPSLRSDDGISGRCPSRAESARTVNRRASEDVEMGDMTRPTYAPYVPPRNSWTPRPPPGQPPAYEGESSSSGGAGRGSGRENESEMTTVSRPEAVVTRP